MGVGSLRTSWRAQQRVRAWESKSALEESSGEESLPDGGDRGRQRGACPTEGSLGESESPLLAL